MMGRISVLIPDVDDWLSLPVAYCLKTSGKVTVHGLSRRRWRPLRLSKLFASLNYVDDDLDPWLHRIDEIVAKQGVGVVLPVSNSAIRALGEHRQTLSCADRFVPLPEPDVFDIATNKASLTDFLTAHGFRQPTTVKVTAGASRPEGLSVLSFPVLAKPPLSSGGNGIRNFETPKALDDFLAGEGHDEDWVVQEFVPGTDLGVNVLCRNGQIIASTVQHAMIPSSVPYRASTSLEFRTDASAMDVAARLIEKLGWSGIANIDMRRSPTSEVPFVFELNGRYWLTLLGSLKAGVNFPLLACETAMGRLQANRQARETRYFGEQGNALLSLLGGGRFRIRPSETDLDQLFRDPMFFIAIQVAKLVKIFRDKFSSIRAAIL